MADISLDGYAWTASSTTVYAMLSDGILELRNDDDQGCVFMSVLPFEIGGGYAHVSFQGEVVYGAPPRLVQSGVVSASHEAPHREISLNAHGIFRYAETELIETRIYLPAHSGCLISGFDIDFFDGESEWDDALFARLEGDVLVVAAECPAWEGDRDRLRVVDFAQAAAQRHAVDVVCPRRLQSCCTIELYGMTAHFAPLQTVRWALRKKRYQKIVVLGFTPEIAQTLGGCDLGNADVVVVADDQSTLHRAHPVFTARYFNVSGVLNPEEEADLVALDEAIRAWAGRSNTTWVFASEAHRQLAQESLGVRFGQVEIIQPFVYAPPAQQAPEAERYGNAPLLCLTDFGKSAAQGADVLVRTLLSLAKSSPGALQADVYGTGEEFDRIVAPLYGIKGVRLHNRFPSAAERVDMYRTHGIALLPRRFGYGNLLAMEAALSGCAVVGSGSIGYSKGFGGIAGAAGPSYIDCAALAKPLIGNTEACKAAARASYEAASNAEHVSVQDYVDAVLGIESSCADAGASVACVGAPVLSIVVPSYNTQHFLSHGIASLMNQENAGKLEVIIVNDGSTDGTLAAAQAIADKYNCESQNRPIIRVVDQCNGGHGSAINTGLAVAQGTYLRIMDSDDWFDSEELARMIDVLEQEDSDIVLTDYSDDRAIVGRLQPVRMYGFMDPGVQYDFDDVCIGSYGFAGRGPTISTGSFRTSMLKAAGCKLSEHCFYVDMELNAYAVLEARTVTYYPFDVYRYFIGREGQSTSASASIRNRSNHTHVIATLIRILEEHPQLSDEKRAYILKMIQQMVSEHYTIVGAWLKDYDELKEFDSFVSAYPDIYHSPIVCTPDTLEARAALHGSATAEEGAARGQRAGKGLLRLLRR